MTFGRFIFLTFTCILWGSFADPEGSFSGSGGGKFCSSEWWCQSLEFCTSSWWSVDADREDWSTWSTSPTRPPSDFLTIPCIFILVRVGSSIIARWWRDFAQHASSDKGKNHKQNHKTLHLSVRGEAVLIHFKLNLVTKRYNPWVHIWGWSFIYRLKTSVVGFPAWRHIFRGYLACCFCLSRKIITTSMNGHSC